MWNDFSNPFTDGKDSSTSFENHPNRDSSSGQGSRRSFSLVVHGESSANVPPPRTDPPPTELDKTPLTLTELARESLPVPVVRNTSRRMDSGIGTELLSRDPAQSLVGDDLATEQEITSDHDFDQSGNSSREDAVIAVDSDGISMWDFSNARPRVFGNGNMEFVIEPLSPTSRSSTMLVDLKYHHNPQPEDNHTSLLRSRQFTRPRRSSY